MDRYRGCPVTCSIRVVPVKEGVKLDDFVGDMRNLHVLAMQGERIGRLYEGTLGKHEATGFYVTNLLEAFDTGTLEVTETDVAAKGNLMVIVVFSNIRDPDAAKEPIKAMCDGVVW